MKKDQLFPVEEQEGRIFLIHHGQTSWNRHHYLGWADIPLDDVGIQQSQEIASLLEQQRLDKIYRSPLIRSIETIQPLAEKRGLPVITMGDLKEMHLGQWQGALKSANKLRIRKCHAYLQLPGGESLFDVYQRAKRFMEVLKADLAATFHLVILGHYRINQIVKGIICQLSFEDIIAQPGYRPGNGSVLDVKYRAESVGTVTFVSCDLMDKGGHQER